jgi:hypothetical protein
MMKKKIKIGYADVDIQLIDKKLFPKWSTEHLGDYDANNQVIRILAKQRPSEELNTLFHEVIHAAVQVSGLNTDKGPLKKMVDEEQVVSGIPRLSKYQIAWHYRRHKAGGKSWILQRTQKDERLKLFEGSGTKDVGTWSPVMELPFPLPASHHNSPVPASRSAFPFVEIFDFIKDKHRL